MDHNGKLIQLGMEIQALQASLDTASGVAADAMCRAQELEKVLRTPENIEKFTKDMLNEYRRQIAVQEEQINNLQEELQKYTEENQRLQPGVPNDYRERLAETIREVDRCHEQQQRQTRIELELIEENSSLRKELDTWKQRASIASDECIRLNSLLHISPQFGFNEYANDASRTESPVDASMVVRLARCLGGLHDVLNQCEQWSVALDAYKKYIFYNRQTPQVMEHVKERTVIDENGVWSDKNCITKRFPERNSSEGILLTDELISIVRLLHGVMGYITEGGEFILPALALVESGLTAPETDEKSLVNIAEEAGDGLWYLALLANALSDLELWNGACDLRSIAETNNHKLRSRYPDKFSQSDANERDLDAEFTVLSGGNQPQGFANTILIDDTLQQVNTEDEPKGVFYHETNPGSIHEETEGVKWQPFKVNEADSQFCRDIKVEQPETAYCYNCHELVSTSEPHTCVRKH